MLYKFCAVDFFADSSDRCGVIQADSIEEAVQRLIRWNKEEQDWGAYGVEADEPKVELAPENDQALVTYTVKELNEPAFTGKDSYIIRPVGNDIISFLAQDWNLAFE